MAGKSKKPLSFWQELKRRKVIRGIIGYAAAAYVILELTSIIAEPLGLPSWTVNFVLILLCIGFIITIVISWIYDFTSGGIHKTVPVAIELGESSEIKTKPAKRRLKVSDIVIAVLVVLVIILAYPRIFKGDKFQDIRQDDGRISIAVMPFQNHTGDTALNWFSNGISSLLINVLGNSSELAVCDDHTMYEVTRIAKQVYSAGISTAKAQGIAQLARTQTYITGSYQGREDTYWVLANLVDTETGDIISTHMVEGDLLSSGYLDMANSLCNEIKNYLEIKAIEQNIDNDIIKVYTSSAEAYRHYIEGLNMILAGDFDPAIGELKKALEMDSTFTLASFFLAYSYNFKSPMDNINASYWIQKAYNTLEKLPIKYQYWLQLWYAVYCSKSQEDIYGNLKMLESSGIDSRLLWADIAVTYQGILDEPEMAVKAFNKVMQLSQERGYYHKDILFYTYFGEALHEAGMHDREKEILELCIDLFKDDISKRECYY